MLKLYFVAKSVYYAKKTPVSAKIPFSLIGGLKNIGRINLAIAVAGIVIEDGVFFIVFFQVAIRGISSEFHFIYGSVAHMIIKYLLLCVFFYLN